MSRDRPPRELFDAEQRVETEEEREDRESRRIGRVWSDCNPRKLQLRPRKVGPPEIRPMKLRMVGPDFTIGFFGKRREGKSFAMRWVLEYLKDQFPRGYVFTNTKMNHFWQQVSLSASSGELCWFRTERARPGEQRHGSVQVRQT